MKYSDKLASRARKLIKAVRTKNLSVIPGLIGKFRGYVVNELVDGVTPLHFAAQIGHPKILELFASTPKVNLDIKDTRGFTALQYVLERHALGEVRILVDAGANVNAKNVSGGQTALHIAAENNVLTECEYLLSKGADVNARDKVGQTPLHSAAFWNDGDSHLKLVEFLLKNGADVNARDYRGRTALFHLVYTGNEKMIELVLYYGADVDAENEEGDVPLFHAVCAGRVEIAQIIIDRCVENWRESKEDWSTNWNNDWRTIRYLSQNANIPALDLDLKSPLDLRMKMSYYRELFVKKLKFILEYLDVYITDGAGNNLLQICESNELWKITVLEHIAKLQALHLPISEYLSETISSNDDCSAYYLQCAAELEVATKTKLGNSSVTYFNLLVDGERKLKNYADLVEDFKKGDCLKRFQIYGSGMLQNMKRGVRRRKIYDKSRLVMNNCLVVFETNLFVVRDVLDCLSTQDLTILCGSSSK